MNVTNSNFNTNFLPIDSGVNNFQEQGLNSDVSISSSICLDAGTSIQTAEVKKGLNNPLYYYPYSAASCDYQNGFQSAPVSQIQSQGQRSLGRGQESANSPSNISYYNYLPETRVNRKPIDLHSYPFSNDGSNQSAANQESFSALRPGSVVHNEAPTAANTYSPGMNMGISSDLSPATMSDSRKSSSTGASFTNGPGITSALLSPPEPSYGLSQSVTATANNNYDRTSSIISPEYSQPQEPLEPLEPLEPKLKTTVWDDEGTLCLEVEVNGIVVARRQDNDMVNGTKLLNVSRMTRGRRDGILKLEKVRAVVKSGPMNYKGVWIPLERAIAIAKKERITDLVYPLFVDQHKIGAYMSSPDASKKKLLSSGYSEAHPTPVADSPFTFGSENGHSSEPDHQLRSQELHEPSPAGWPDSSLQTSHAFPGTYEIPTAGQQPMFYRKTSQPTSCSQQPSQHPQGSLQSPKYFPTHLYSNAQPSYESYKKFAMGSYMPSSLSAHRNIETTPPAYYHDNGDKNSNGPVSYHSGGSYYPILPSPPTYTQQHSFYSNPPIAAFSQHYSSIPSQLQFQDMGSDIHNQSYDLSYELEESAALQGTLTNTQAYSET